jgi:hypothetical protein
MAEDTPRIGEYQEKTLLFHREAASGRESGGHAGFREELQIDMDFMEKHAK